MRKLYFNSLTNLKLEGNPIPNAELLFESNFIALKCLSLENSGEFTEMGVSLRWIIRANIRKLSNICTFGDIIDCKEDKRIQEDRIQNKIKQKYKEKKERFIYVPCFGKN